MQVITYPLGQLQANCYILIQDKQCLIIDPGDSAEFLLEEIQRRSLDVIGIFATHGHFDHIMAVGELQLSLSVPLHIHEKDSFLLKRLISTATHFLGFNPQCFEPTIIRPITNGQLRINEFEITIIETPGHTPGSCCFYFKEDQLLFTGDTLFIEGIGSYEHSYSSKKDLLHSVSQLRKIANGSMVYPGHGESFVLED